MDCTMSLVIGDEYSGSFCNQWRSKQRYNKLALGGDTKFVLLYVDFEIFGTRFANKNIEGGVRPPSLVNIFSQIILIRDTNIYFIIQI